MQAPYWLRPECFHLLLVNYIFCLFVIGPLHLSEHALWRASGISFFITNCLLPSHWIWPWNVFTYCIIGPWDLWDLAEYALRRSSGISFFIASHWLRPECSLLVIGQWDFLLASNWTTASGRTCSSSFIRHQFFHSFPLAEARMFLHAIG